MAREHGTYAKTGQKVRPLEERFWSKVDRSGGADSCWPWTASLNNGYGQIRLPGGGVERAHRVAFELTYGYWPSVVRHTCDNPPCCNPAHLLGGTHADNVRDMIERGRANFEAAALHRSKTHCPHGHTYTPENTYWKRRGRYRARVCRTCDLAAQARYRERRRSA